MFNAILQSRMVALSAQRKSLVTNIQNIKRNKRKRRKQNMELTDKEGYSQFKKYLADHQEIAIEKMEVLSSPDPLVNFTFTIEGDKHIAYGTETEKKMFDTNLGLYLAFCIVFGVILLPSLILEGTSCDWQFS